MQFLNRDQFKSAASSEKITLATINAKKRLYVFNSPSMGVYSKQVPYYVVGIQQSDSTLTEVNSLVNMQPGEWFYDVKNSTLYVRPIGDVAPNTVEIIAVYRLFYSDKSLSLSANLLDIDNDVYWDGRITASPGYKHKIGIDQSLTSLVGEGTLTLKNQDGGLDEVYDTLIFENQECVIYSWNPDLQPSESRVIYRGKVTNKTYNENAVSFKIKDQIFSLLDSPNIEQYTAQDNVANNVQGQFKRLVYGRVDGLKCQSISQIADGIPLTGTLTMNANDTQIIGVGTQFLSETLQGDKITVGTQEFTIASVDNDNQLTTEDEADFAFSGLPGGLLPERGTVNRNREYLAAGHLCAEVTHTIVNFPQFNRVVLNNTEGLFAGDFIQFDQTGERIEIRNIAPGNIVVLQQNVITKADTGTTITRRPIQEVFIDGVRVNANDYSVNNSGGQCGVLFDTDAEFNLANPRNTKFNATFTNGSRTINVVTSEVSLSDVFTPGDFIKPNDLTYTTFYKVINVNDTTLDIDTAFLEPTISDIVEIIEPNYLTDDSQVSVNILGKTEDGTAFGTWISSVAQAQRDLIQEVGITTFNTQSFIDGIDDAPQLISLAVPIDFESKTPPTVKSIIDLLSISTNSSLTLDNDLLVKFKSLNVFTGEDLPVITDSDVIGWKIKATNGKTPRRVFSRYRFQDVNNLTLEPGNNAFTFDSQFVERYIGTNKVEELDLYLYNQLDAEIATRRFNYYNRLSVSTLTINTDLRLEDIEIGDVVIADFRRLYRRFGDSTIRKKAVLVIGKTLTGSRTELILSDLGNTFNTSGYITPNDAPDYVAATAEQKLIYGYITDNQGIVNNDEDTAGVHLIS